MNNRAKVYFIECCLFFSASASTIFSYLNAFIFHKKFPWNTFLFEPSCMFTDLYESLAIAERNNPYLNGYNKSMYLPLANFVLHAASIFSPTTILIMYYSCFMIFVYAFFFWSLREHTDHVILTSAIFTLCNYPLLFTLDRGNIEGGIFVLVLLYFYCAERRSIIWASLFISIATAFKAYPLLFLLYSWRKRQYAAIVYSCVFIFVLTVGSLASFENGLLDNTFSFIFGNSALANQMMIDNNFFYPSLSIYALFKLAYIKFGLKHLFTYAFVWNSYILTVAFFFVLNIFAILKLKPSEWQAMFLIVSMIIVFPTVSASYKLLYAFIPLIGFLKVRTTKKIDYLYSFLFVIIVVPLQFYFIDEVVTDANVFVPGTLSVGIPIKAISILLLNLIIILDCVHSCYSEEWKCAFDKFVMLRHKVSRRLAL